MLLLGTIQSPMKVNQLLVGRLLRIPPHLHLCMLDLEPTGHDCLDQMPFDGRWVKDSADCLVDVGQEYDPDQLRFDHRPPAFRKRTDSCAAKLVWEHLMGSGLDLAHLQPLIQVTFEGDSGRASPELRASRANGPHAKLAKLKETTTDDDEVFHHMVIWLRRHFRQITGDADNSFISKIGKRQGTYALIFHCDAIQTLEIGRLGMLTTEPGFYIYTGSAFGPGGVAARVSRHSRRDKPMHWHIDYLRPVVQLLEVWYTHDSQQRECSWSEILASMKGATVPLAGFGSSDCTSGCQSHLHFFRLRPSVATFRRRVRLEYPGHTEIYAVHVSD